MMGVFDLLSQEELAEGLHLIDFEQLKIENQTYNEKIEERNEVSGEGYVYLPLFNESNTEGTNFRIMLICFTCVFNVHVLYCFQLV